MSHDQRFLLIGGAGLVGRHIRVALADRDVIATYRRDAPQGSMTLDITDVAAARRVVLDSAAKVVILAAADAWVEHCEREPAETRKVNVDAPRAIAEAAAEIDALLVVFSSEYVFDGTAGEYVEDDNRHALNEYGRQKVALEDVVLSTGRALVCRTSAVFGDDPQRKNFVCQLIDRLTAGRSFDVADDQLVTPTYAPALAAAVVALADRSASGVFHVAGPRVMNRADFAEEVAQVNRLDTRGIHRRPTNELGLIAVRPLRCGLTTDKLRATLGESLTEPMKGLREMASERAH
jgi:dTDP-4-dehydrorhamnose reductase